MGARDVMKSQIKLVANKTCSSVILEYFLKYKYIKEVVTEMALIIALLTK